MNLTKSVKSITGTYKKLSMFGKILLFIICLLILLSFFRSKNTKQEGFEQIGQFIFKKGPAMYDNFYATVYDHVVNSSIESDFEIGTIINSTHPTSESIILDVGSRTGARVSKLGDRSLDVIGIDISPFMIKKSMMNYPDHKFVVGNALKIGQFQTASFTHILCLDRIIYSFEDKRQLMDNFIDWLIPGGYFVLHLVDIANFNPVSNKNKLPTIVTNSKKHNKSIKTTDYDYTSNYTLNNNIGTIIEKFQFHDGRVRKQEEQLHMEDKETILNIVQQCGFTLHSIVDVLNSDYGKQYIYIFVKP